jgi:hypothetical protein
MMTNSFAQRPGDAFDALQLDATFPFQDGDPDIVPECRARSECLAPSADFSDHKQFNVPFGIFPAELLRSFYESSCFDWPPTPEPSNRLRDFIPDPHARDHSRVATTLIMSNSNPAVDDHAVSASSAELGSGRAMI